MPRHIFGAGNTGGRPPAGGNLCLPDNGWSPPLDPRPVDADLPSWYNDEGKRGLEKRSTQREKKPAEGEKECKKK